MAGSKHARSAGIAGEVSPLAAQLQQAWLHVQMLKATKRSGISASSQLKSSVPLQEQSALESLSSIFPELGALPQKKKPMMFSVFEDDEYPKPKEVGLNEDSSRLFPSLLPDTQGVANITHTAPLPHRPLSTSPVVHNSNSSEHLAAAPVLACHNFSENSSLSSPQDAYSPDEYKGSSASQGEAGSPSYLADLDAIEFSMTEGEANNFQAYVKSLVDEEPESNKCMLVESSAYHAMAKELGDLIGEDSCRFDSETSEKDLYSDTWRNEFLGCPAAAEILNGLKDGSRSFTNDQADQLLNLYSGNSSLWASSRRDMHPEAGDADSTSHYFNSASLSASSEDALHHSHSLNEGNSFVSKPTISLQISNGYDIPPVDLKHLLLRCAQAIEQKDLSQANKLIAELRQHSSTIGSAVQRKTHYFVEALVARMTGTGGQLYTALNNTHPSSPDVLKAFLSHFNRCPLLKLSYSYANLAIMHAFGDAKRVHIVDYGILYGMQWPSLIYHLSKLPGGPPHLRITGIDWPKPGFRPTERIQETGHRLAHVAQQLGVPFDFHAIAEKWEAITPAHLFLRSNEVLVINCIYRLHHLFDESVMAASPRNLCLSKIQSMNPKIFVHGVVNGNYNAPFFMSRFQGVMDYHMFESIDSALPPDSGRRVIIEQEIFGCEILNIVACEGVERVERAEPYSSWQARTLRAGFTKMPILESAKARIRAPMRHFSRNFAIGEDDGWFLAGWKEKVIYALSVWQPASRMTSSKQSS